MENVLKRIQDYALEDIMGERFGAYAKEIIQDRAIPDVRDGLKPVQRRILYGMYKDHNTYEKPYRKSAKTVGYRMGNSSTYTCPIKNGKSAVSAGKTKSHVYCIYEYNYGNDYY